MIGKLEVGGLSLSDEEEYQRRASQRAVDPISRSMLASAEARQDYIDKSIYLDQILFNPCVVLLILFSSVVAPIVTFLMSSLLVALIVLVIIIGLDSGFYYYAWQKLHQSQARTSTTPSK